MTKKTKKTSREIAARQRALAERQEAELATAHAEMSRVRACVECLWRGAEMVAVDAVHHEVSFWLLPDEFGILPRTAQALGFKFKLEKSDHKELSAVYSYEALPENK